MQLVEKGELALDARLPEYLAGAPYAWQNVTIKQMLSHTSGIPDYFGFDEFTGEISLAPDAIIEAAKKQPLEFEPGTDFDYSNTNYVILGKLIELASGQAYAEYLRQQIFDPLQMSATGRDNGDQPLATGYASYGVPAQTFPITNALGDGDLLSTVGDMYKFDRALYGDALLSASSREQMFNPIGDNHYGLGWETQDWRGHRIVSHNGGIAGFRSQFTRFPDDDALILFLSNIESFDAAQAAQDITAMIFP
jgi:CubicO group peptidase (beta-lactamase class C family)